LRLISTSQTNNQIREKVFTLAFGEAKGVIAIGTKSKEGRFSEVFFRYPEDMPKLLEWINKNINGRNMYFCPQLLSKPKRIKPNVLICTNIWADLDEADPSTFDLKPSITIKTSDGRWQGLWLLSSPTPPETGEQAARKLTYAVGADPSGWDLTQYLRVPLTYNLKYDDMIVEVTEIEDEFKYDIQTFLDLPEVPEHQGISDVEFPDEKIKKLDPDKILEKHRDSLLPSVFTLYSTSPTSDWSATLWSLENMLLEAGLTLEETFAVCWTSASNKYARDERTRYDLWKEILKAKKHLELQAGEESEGANFNLEPLLTHEEENTVKLLPDSFVEKYIKWAKNRSDAAPSYHEAGAFTILSALLAENIRLPTSFGNLIPNLWFLILGDTTLTRKTTAMDMAMELLLTVYEDCVLATDGSLEGILTALALRQGQASIFWRDEFSGMLDAMKRRDYYAGMVEVLTKLYDGKYQKRILRKEIIEIRDPVFIMFCGGIKSRIVELFDTDYIINGFIPRFIYLVAEPDMKNFKPAGPSNNEIQTVSTKLVEELFALRNRYDSKTFITMGDNKVAGREPHLAELTQEAWDRYNVLERQLMEAGAASDNPEYFTPTMDRMSKSCLKVAVLLAALREQKDRKVIVEIEDILHAIKYIASWIPHTVYIVSNSGKSLSEKTIDRAYLLILGGKKSRSHLMRSMHLTSREADLILDTLEQRGLIVRSKSGKLERLFPAYEGRG
jgi:hypothetical protein